MSRRTPPALAGLLLLATLIPSASFAGNNAGGQAFLSWDRAGTDSLLSKIPAEPFPLFLHLRDAPDVHALAARIIWTTNTVGALPCYSLVSASTTAQTSAPDSLRGWAFDTPPGQDFAGDTTYRWTIAFDAEDHGKNCVEYRVSGAACAGTPRAEFLAASVMVMDAVGRIDTLAVTGGASIARQIIDLAVEQVSPRRIPMRLATDLSIIGRGFELGSRVFLQRGGQRIEADQVAVSDSTEMVARVVSPFSDGDSLDLVIEHPAGVEASLNSGLQATGTSQGTFHRPTNDDFAFTQVPLHAPTREQNSYLQDPVNHPEWPSALNSPNLLVVRSPGDTAAVIGSYPYNGLGFVFDRSQGNTPSWVRLYLGPPRLATSLATLVTSGLTFKDQSVDFDDTGKPILRVQVNYEGGDTTIAHLVIGTHVRNWVSGQMWCSPRIRPYFDTRPTDTLVAQIYSGPGQTGSPPPTVHYDLQEVLLPTERRAKRIASIEFLAEPVYHTCANYIDGTSGIFGLAVWPKFKVTDAEGDTVVRLSQNTGNAYGGYLFNGAPVGTRRTMNANACQISCIAMLASFHGMTWATPDSLNRFLRSVHGGYDRENIANITAVATSGDTVYFTGGAWKSRDWQAGSRSRFLIEHGPYNPIATVQVDSQPPPKPAAGWDRPAVGHVVTWHQAGTIAAGDSAFTYRWPNLRLAGRGYLQNALRVSTIPEDDPEAAAEVESLLVRNEPVYVLTHSKTPGGWHFVVADGWKPGITAADAASGTYSLQDPAYAYERLLRAPFNNEFRYARHLVPVGGGLAARMRPQSAMSSGDGPVLRVLLSGVGALTLTDPGGRSLAVDEGGAYSNEIPDLVVTQNWGDDDDDDASEGGDLSVVELEAPVDGRYTLRVNTADDANFAASASTSDETGLISGGSAASSEATAHGETYALDYSSMGGTVQLTFLATTGVQAHETAVKSKRLTVLRNPSSTRVNLAFTLDHEGSCLLEFFDLQGRQIDHLDLGLQAVGSHVVQWNATTTAIRSGVYFARLRAGQRLETARVVVTR